MADARNDLLLCALRRATSPLASGDVLDAAVGLATAEGWEPAQLADLTRRSASKRLQNLVESGLALVAGSALDETSRRMTPTYSVKQPDPHAAVPPPPSTAREVAKASPYDNLEKSQLIALLDVHDSLAQCVSRHMQDLDGWREKSRQRLLAVGLGER